MSYELHKKIDQALKLLQVSSSNDIIEISYSGGKDSDVILELARMSGIKYRAIHSLRRIYLFTYPRDIQIILSNYITKHQ